ncbi:SulP family inorganic anion transporter [Sediminicola sp. 1XM1-17]|uniref:SulP family inorganic anion transporter n=1 Tax=Sediminicola sp. 1XM1-17 TaxID=3127702 RepID=UPI003077383B
MRKFFPFLDWLPKYQKKFLGSDLVAGFTVGVILIPQGMAYAMIAGLPPVYGLYASLFPILIYALMGTSRQVAIGPVAMDSLLVAAGLGALAITSMEEYIIMAVFLAFMVGAIQLTLGLLRMGFLVNFMSKPVISGFTSAAALTIIFSQLKHLLGANIPNSNQFHQMIVNAFQNISTTNLYDLAIGIMGILIIVLLKRWNKKFPSVLLVVLLGGFAVYFLGLEGYGVNVVGVVPEGLPSFTMPAFGMGRASEIFSIALALALVGYLETISIGKALEEKSDKETIDANQELVALGTSNMVGSFFQSYPVTSSFSRSAINAESGAKSTVAQVFSVLLVVITLLFLTPLFYFLPNAALASIIMVSVFGLIDIPYPQNLWKHRKDEFWVLVITFLVTLFIGIKEGILVGVLVSLLVMVYRTSKPHFAVLGNIRGTDYYRNIYRFEKEVIVRDDILIVRFDAQLYFGNTNFFKTQLFKQIEAKGPGLKLIILNAEAINYIDSTAAKMLVQVIDEIHKREIEFYIAGAIGPTRDIIFTSGIIDVLHKECLFVRITEAVKYFDDPANISLLGKNVAYQNRVIGN